MRKLFQDIAGYDLDERLVWIVEELVRIFLATDVASIMKNFGRSTKQEDPVVHFYETFLASYSPALRKARGVWYTPQPVVNFIVRAVDDILKTEFNLKEGLADTSKTTIKVKAPKLDERSKQKGKVIGDKYIEQEVHKVQILDPATGTGTFLAEVVRHIHKKFEGQQGIWSKYVKNDLIPRLNGFELLMASYAMAHLKMDMLLTETGYKPTDDQRFRIFLTNSLEEHHKDTGTIFSHWLADEANQANAIKRDAPVMVVIGNPPYSGESSNKGEWIMTLMDSYKKEPGGKVKLKEQNSKFINDDYVKFIRFGQHFIEKNGEGILAYINPHGFLDNPTFRGMRWNLLKAFDKIYTIDLHGNSKKKETAPDGSIDQNVFDIQQGVSINLFIKTGEKKKDKLAKVFHYDLYGKREVKYNFLISNKLNSVNFEEIKTDNNMYFFQNKNLVVKNPNIDFNISHLFNVYSLGSLTKRDRLSIGYNKEEIKEKAEYFLSNEQTIEEVCKHFGIKTKDNDKWDASATRENVSISKIPEHIKKLYYRPFDHRYILYDPYFVARPNTKILDNLNKPNLAIISGRQGQAVGSMSWNLSFITNTISDQNIYYRGGGTVFPLYLYPDNNGQLSTDGEAQRAPNLNPKLVKQIAKGLGLQFVPEKEMLQQAQHDTTSLQGGTTKQSEPTTFAPIDLLDYIYAVLHAPSYREKYKEFLKIDFPRVPYPTDAAVFWELVALGGKLRQIHLLESPVTEQYITQYPTGGDNVVGKLHYQDGKVYINYDKATPEAELQCFTGVPETAWNFYIGGYQPAQKWLKDRKGRELSNEDVFHYQKIIVALTETHRLMQEIDTVLVPE